MRVDYARHVARSRGWKLAVECAEKRACVAREGNRGGREGSRVRFAYPGYKSWDSHALFRKGAKRHRGAVMQRLPSASASLPLTPTPLPGGEGL